MENDGKDVNDCLCYYQSSTFVNTNPQYRYNNFEADTTKDTFTGLVNNLG